jgi:ankyrin repeat protein
MIERMFKWIVCSRQPLHVNELSEGVAFTLCDQDWSPDKIPTNFHRLVRACGNLVVIDEDTSIVHLAHYTVQQYLLSHTESKFHFTLKEAHLMAGEFCVAYLNFTNFESHITLYTKNRNTDVAALEKLATNRSYGALIAQDNPGRRAIKVFHALRGSTDTGSVNINMARHLPYSKEKAPDLSAFYFLPYVVIHWLWHTTTIDMKHDTAEDAIDSRSLRILKFKNLVFDKKMLFKFRPWDELPEISADLRYIAMLGLGLMANHGYLIQSMFDRGLLLIDIFDEIKKWCLEQGVREKDVDSVRISRSIQACVESFSAESYVLQAPALEGLPVAWLYSRFIYACKKGHLDAILECAVLIPHELNIHLFIIAASSGHLPLVKFLLLSTAYGDKLDLREVTMACANLGGINLNACEHALLAGHSDVVTYLESEGHHFKRLFSDLHDPLLLDAMVKAIRHGRRDVVQIMLEHGVSPYATDSAGCNAFCEALRFKRRSIVDLLLTHGYSLNSTNYELPLTIAAATGDCRLVELLVYHGAAVFSYDYEHHGSANPVSVIMQDVEDDGWVIVQDDNDNGWGSFRIYLSPTPLYVACCHGHEDIVKLLVSHGAAVDLPSPAALAYLTLTKETPDAKLSAQLTVDSQEVPFVKPSRMSNWELPIVAAAARGHKDIVNFLLQSGSLPSDGRQRSAEFLMKNSVLQEIPSQAQVLIEREILASWANSTKLSPVQLEGFIYAGVDASDLTRDGKALFVWCLANEDFQTRDTILNSTSDRADFLHRSLVNFAKMCPTDMAITGQLISLGAVPYVRDELGIPEANQSLVSAALNSNAKLRIAFINSGVEFAIALAAKDPGYFTGRPARSLTQPNVSLKALVRLFEALNPGLKNSEYLLPFEKLCNILGCAGNHPEVAQKIFETLLFPSTQTLSLSYFVFLAIENNNLSLLKALHNNGINLNRWRKSDGTNPLMATASQNNSLALATFLLSLGADPHAKDAAGATALDRASAARNYRVAGLLYPYMYNSAS